MCDGQAYCMKCKKKVDIVDPVEVKTDNGKYRTKGKCAECGMAVSTFIKSKCGKEKTGE